MPRAALALLLVLAAGACVITSGPDCSDACAKVVECDDLDKVFLLACGTNSVFCDVAEAACAECIDTHDCAALVRGDCDVTKLADGGTTPLCLVSP